jgi:2-oxoglutarate dehydrogenase E2 component (dihydrolipoamide succinyltransferase)
MPTEVTVPQIGESITEVEIGEWLKQKGDRVAKDEPLVTIDSEKATLEVPSPAAGILSEILKSKGQVAKIGEVIGHISSDGGAGGVTSSPSRKPAAASETPSQPAPASELRIMPAAQRAMAELNIKPEQVKGTGPGGRVLKEDVLRQAESTTTTSAPVVEQELPRVETREGGRGLGTVPPLPFGREEEVVPMSRLRRTVAERLVQAQHTAALLTTFNEVDLTTVIALRKEHGEAFQQKHGVKLGFMGFFIKACIDALKQFPVLNARLEGTNIVYHNYYDIGVAVGGGKGLVVPVLRNAERMSFAAIEVAIGDFARRARENKLRIDELQGGTFTISNGGVYGSLLSTPIINPPQSGVLGMHAIQERPVARDGAVVIRSMMYIALTYDHRLVDGREAVSFLKRVKDAIENPVRMLVEI